MTLYRAHPTALKMALRPEPEWRHGRHWGKDQMRPFAQIILALALATACGPKPEALPPAPSVAPPPATTSPETPAPSPSAPACKSIDEGCKVESGKPLPVSGLASVELPAGWTYADSGTRLVTRPPDKGA